MNAVLRSDKEAISAILQQVGKLADEHFHPTELAPPSRYVPDDPFADLPAEGWGALDVLVQFRERYAPRMANSAGPRYFGFVTGGSTPASLAGDWLVSVYDQVMSGSTDSVAHFLERQTLHFLKQLFGLDTAYTGTFVTGATMSNFVSLASARQWIGEQQGINLSEDGLYGMAPMRVLSATPHSSILKSLSMLGMGRKSWVNVETLPGREAIDPRALEAALAREQGPVVVVANAGTVNTVDFDNMEAIGALKQKYNFWLHVDAAFGGFAACSPQHQHLMRGINLADSVTIDAHKWLNVPYDAAMQFTRHKSIQVKVFQNQAAYLGDPALMPDSMHVTPENSRRFRALPSWFTLLAYGRNGYREIVERNCAVAHGLGERLEHSEEFRLLAPVRMNIVCFSFRNETTLEEIRTFLDAIRDDGRVFFTPTVYKGTPAIRAAISNWQTGEADGKLAFEVLQAVYRAQALKISV
ncbi:aspartate aminotransferase family protein [Fulvivirgaceae bacterium PWU5]|uniref:Aspartate aminotransferase family protein n=1 Tax=Dawidia cretensis TaxID=2782350 RepID=A0AAP2E0A7_9BACT|nr:pyridoxal-dependent decarboxylase [Dawidia cretensis]MBT1710825.1 aspartate aminotransferase family protein [Dawidia cretensis]